MEQRANPAASSPAMQDLIELTLLAKDEPAASQALKEHFEFSVPVLVIDVERDSTMIAGKPIVHFKLNETLMAHLVALRAKQRKDRPRQNINCRFIYMPVADIPVHDLVRKTTSHPGCHNRKPFAAGYWAPDRRYFPDGRFEQTVTWVPHGMSTRCNFDGAIDPKGCDACEHKRF